MLPWELLTAVREVPTHQMIMKKGTAKASDVMPWTRDWSELGKVLTVLGTTSQVVLELMNGPQALEEGMLQTQTTELMRRAPRLSALPPHAYQALLPVTFEQLPELTAFWNILVKSA